MAIFELLLVSLAVVGIAHACSVAQGWERKSVEERASKPQWVVYGTVVSDHTSVGAGHDIEQEYTVTVEPLCWLKQGREVSIQNEGPEMTDSIVEFENITVLEVTPCVANDLVKGKKYIFFLGEEDAQQGRFSTWNVNVESGALEEPTDETIEAVHRGIDAGLKGYPHGECVEGVEIPCFVGEADPKVCNLGVAFRAAVWSIIIGAVVAITGYY